MSRGTAALLLALLMATPAAAQDVADPPPETVEDPRVEPTARQLALAKRANDAFRWGNYDDAVRYLNTAMEEGELNILMLNLGRSLHKLDRCAEAKAVYQRLPTVPKVLSPEPEIVEAQLTKYLDNLNNTCPGQLIARCEPEVMELIIDDRLPRPCNGEPIALAPGEHIIQGRFGDQLVVETVFIEAAVVAEVALEIIPPMAKLPDPKDAKDGPKDVSPPDKVVKIDPPDIKQPPDEIIPEPDDGGGSVWGWSALGSGLAIVGATAAVDQFVLGTALEDYESAIEAGDAQREDDLRGQIDLLRPTLIATYTLGGLLATTGAILLLTDTESEPADPGAASIEPWVAPGTGGVLISGEW